MEDNAMYTRKARTIRLKTKEEVEALAIGKDKDGNLWIEANAENNVREKFELGKEFDSLYGEEIYVMLENKKQDPTPDGMVDENGFRLWIVDQSKYGVNHVPDAIVAEVTYR